MARARKATTGIRIGCAGWSIPAADRALFGDGGSALARYATRFAMVEINSSFYRPHRRETYACWAASVPRSFRFTAKLPRTITHEARLKRCGALLDAFLAQCGGLGDRLGCLLVQLPPSFALEPRVASTFFAMLRRRWDGGVACEPRHASWFDDAADALLRRHRIARVAADPAPHPGAASPAGEPSLRYWRWHGAPDMYWSAYDESQLAELARRVAADAPRAERYVVFDNTARGHAVPNAARFEELVARENQRRR